MAILLSRVLKHTPENRDVGWKIFHCFSAVQFIFESILCCKNLVI